MPLTPVVASPSAASSGFRDRRRFRFFLVVLATALGLLSTGVFPVPSASAQGGVGDGKQQASLALAGGGVRAHTNHSAWLMAAVNNSGRDLNGVLENVNAIGANSGGTWWLTQAAWDFDFAKGISNGDFAAYQKTGYLGQLRDFYAQFDGADCDKWKYRVLCDLETKYGAYFLMLWSLSGEKLSWHEAVTKLVFEPYNMETSLKNTNLSDARQPWSADKSLVFAATALTKDVVLNQHGILEEHGFYSTVSVPTKAISTPVSIVDPPGSAAAKSSFLAGPQTFNYGNHAALPNDTPHSATPPVNIDANLFGVIDTAAASSAAVGAVASVSALKTLGIPGVLRSEAAWELSDMSVPVTAVNDRLAYARDLKTDSIKADELAEGSYQRLADGAYGDNTSAAGVLRNLQDDDAEGFNLVVFDDAVAGGPVKTGDGRSFHMGESAAQLFGYESKDGLAKECFSTTSPCLEKPSPQVFAKDVALSTSPEWEYQQSGVGVSIGTYDVTTLENDAWGIDAGKSGTVTIVSSYSDAGMVPTKTEDFNDYDKLMNVINTGVSQQGGWPYLRDALMIPIAPAPPVEAPQSQENIGKKLPVKGKKVVNKKNARTQQGQKMRAKVTRVSSKGLATRGDVACYKAKKKRKRKLVIKTTGQCAKVKIWVTYKAAGNATYEKYENTTKFKTRR